MTAALRSAGPSLRRAAVLVGLALAVTLVNAAPPNLAPGFDHLDKSAKVVVMPVDVELFSLSAGGVAEPRADWTSAAQTHMNAELGHKLEARGLNGLHMEESEADEFGEQMALYAAVARSINLHHAMGNNFALPTKAGQLDWSFGDAMKGLQAKTGARYGLFIWVRDSYSSGSRVAMMFLLAAVGVGIGGGVQQGYASLVDLEDGRVLWFNRLFSATGDLRDAASASKSIDSLLTGFPSIQ